jgi:hypothetical protein
MLTVSLDKGEPVLRAPLDLIPVLDPAGAAWVGFMASAGFGYQNHDILAYRWRRFPPRPAISSEGFSLNSEIRFVPHNCLEGLNLCTPQGALVQDTELRQYHVILPAHQAWAASVPNPEGRLIRIGNLRGFVCPDLKEQPCGGPEGSKRKTCPKEHPSPGSR